MIQTRAIESEVRASGKDAKRRTILAYRALVLFSAIYFLRPEDFIPVLNYIPVGKIAGGIAFLALIFGFGSKQRQKLPVELKILLLLLVQMLLCIPLAYWRGGAADTVINRFSKGVIVALLIGLVVFTLDELRKLLYVQSASVALVSFASIFAHHLDNGRLMGIQKGILENPNDLAINIAINFPLCLAFMLAAKGGLRKVLWAIGIVAMMYAVVATYSRSGLIAMVITSFICLWEFVIKGRRMLLLMAAGLLVVIGLSVVVTTPGYLLRVESIVKGNIEGSMDRGSMEGRAQLLATSLQVTMRHPFFGIGPGNFPAYAGGWQVAHNTYTELSAEAGVPALFLFVLLLTFTLRKIRSVRKLPGHEADERVRLWTSALLASLAAYITAAMFGSTEYNLFPYFMVGYICALHKIASASVEAKDKKPDDRMRMKELRNGAKGKRELAWTR